MKIQGKLKDIVIIPDNNNDYEREEIIRITEMFKDDPEAMFYIKGTIHTAGWGPAATNFQFYLDGIIAKGIDHKNW